MSKGYEVMHEYCLRGDPFHKYYARRAHRYSSFSLESKLDGIPLRGPRWKVKAKVEVDRREAVCSD